MNKTEFSNLDASPGAERPRRERVRRIDRFCDRLFGELDGEVVALTRVVESRTGHGPALPLEAGPSAAEKG